MLLTEILSGKAGIGLFALIFILTASLATLSCGPAPERSYAYLGEHPAYNPMQIHPTPADGDTVQNDPPGFNWQPEDQAVGFILELSRDDNFPASENLLDRAHDGGDFVPVSLSDEPLVAGGGDNWLVARLPICLYHPSFGLGPGRWYWRWRNVFADHSISPPSFARAFIVAEGAVAYPVPTVRELLSRIPSSHPRLFIRPEQLDSLRQLAVNSAPHQKLFGRIRAYADTLLGLPIMQEPPPFPEGQGFRYDLWRKYYDQARQMGQVLDFLGFCYLITGDTKYSDRVREWFKAEESWDLKGTTSMSYDDEVAMPILLCTARAYDWIYGTLTDQERQAVRDMLKVRGEQAYARWWEPAGPYHRQPYASHQTRLVNYMSQVGTVFYGELPEAQKWLSYVLPVATSFYPAWGGRDGGYSEGPNYWRMYFNYMLQSAFCIERAMGLDVLRTPFYRNDGWYKIYGDPYFAVQRPFADTGIGAYWPADKINLYRLASVFHNPYFRWRADLAEPRAGLPVNETVVPTGVMSFFWLDEGPEAPKPRPPADLPRSKVFRDIGLAAFHEDPSNPDETYLLFKSSPYGAWSHIYADQNSFYVQAFGEALAIQSGYYPHYGHPHHQSWTWQTRAHNSILVDGQGQKARDRTSRGRIFDWSFGDGSPGSLDYAAGDATEAYPGVLDRFVRRVYYQRPHDFLIVDDIRALAPSRFDWLLHSLEKMEIDEKSRTVTIKRGKARLAATFLSPAGLVFSQNNKFTDDPGESYDQPGYFYPDQWHLTVSTTEKSKSAVFAVKMRVWREE